MVGWGWRGGRCGRGSGSRGGRRRGGHFTRLNGQQFPDGRQCVVVGDPEDVCRRGLGGDGGQLTELCVGAHPDGEQVDARLPCPLCLAGRVLPVVGASVGDDDADVYDAVAR